jgi:hypothetical protein
LSQTWSQHDDFQLYLAWDGSAQWTSSK